jgi:hypothetical protein
LEPPSSWSWRIQGVVASFRLEPINRGLEPPSSWSWRIQGVVASFRLEPVNRGLEPPSSWCWRILEFGASYECNLLIYKKSLCGFLPFGFPHKILVYYVFVVICYALLNGIVNDILNAIISDKLIDKLKITCSD